VLRARSIGVVQARAPIIRNRAGRTNARKLTITATGLPGSPNSMADRPSGPPGAAMRPTAIGRPGRIAMRQNATPPLPPASLRIITRVWSASPALTPPLVMIASALARGLEEGRLQGDRIITHHTEIHDLDAQAAEQAEHGVAVAVVYRAGCAGDPPG
jgi:hypothetical protein